MQAFAELLQAPQVDAQAIIRERFPVPRLVICDQHGSQVLSLCTSYVLYVKPIIAEIAARCLCAKHIQKLFFLNSF